MNSKYTLNTYEVEQINEIVTSIQIRVKNYADLYKETSKASHLLPLKVRQSFSRIRDESTAPYFLLSGLEVNDDSIGITPATTKPEKEKKIIREEILLTLIGSLLGFPFSFATQQEGRLIQNIVPMKSVEYSQLGAGSQEDLIWHTEDAFHPHRPDYILLLGMRNNEGVPTTVAELPDDLSKDEIDLLFSENFYFLPDPDHANHLSDWETDAEQVTFDQMQKFVKSPKAEAILYGSRDNPYMRLDPAFTDVASKTDPSAKVYKKLIQKIEQSLLNIALKPGEILILDNHRVVHGRRSFNPKYDGTDRWIKKINITLDTKKSRANRIHDNIFVL